MPELPTIPINLNSAEIIEGTDPITLIGANGVGKTRFGAYLVATFSYDRVSAQRMLSLAGIGMQTPANAKRESEQQITQARANVSDPVNDLQAIMADLKAEDVQSASDYRDTAIKLGGNGGVPEETNLGVLKRLWGLVFPGRELDLSGYEPKARWYDPSRASEFYSTSAMSDGERSAFYHIARLLKAKAGPVVIDEPEIHFHPMLARRFWDLIEAHRSDCRFIYITHDLGFAMSRRGRIGIVRGPQTVELLDPGAEIPPELFESILGAASLSVVADRIVFCEGTPEKSVDVSFYGAWFRPQKTAVVPVGSCEVVRRTFATFTSTQIIRNANPVAIVERDYWPEAYLERLEREGMHVLPTHEIEGLLAIPSAAEAVAHQLAISDFSIRYSNFEAKLRTHFIGVRLNKLVLERAKRDVDVRLLGLANAATPDADRNVTRSHFTAAVDLAAAVPDAGQLYDEHELLAVTALASDASQILRVFPGKECLGYLSQMLGISNERYIELVMEALNQPDVGGKSELEALRAGLVAAISPHLPPRE